MRVYHFTSTTGDFAPSPIRGWVMCEDAEANIEKARREGMATQMQICEHHVETARADERERIVQIIKGLYSNRGTVTTHQLHEILDCIASLPPQEPKPLERFGPNEIWQPAERKLNALVDVVNDLLRRMNEISPGNRP